MHTETYTTDIERYITAHRATLAVLVGATLALLLSIAWQVLAPLLFRIESANMGMAVSLLTILGSTIAALAWYWSAE